MNKVTLLYNPATTEWRKARSKGKHSTEMGRLLSFSAEQPSTQNVRFVTYTT